MTASRRWGRLVAAYRPPSRSGRLLSLGAAVDSVGTGLFLSLLPLYLVVHLDIAPAAVGVAISVANALGMAAVVAAGRLVDRYGAGRAWMVLAVARLVGYAGYLFVGSFWEFVALTCLLVPLDRSSGVAQQSFVVRSERPELRNQTMAGIRTARNVGMSVGLVLSGVLAGVGSPGAYRLGFALNALSYAALLAAVLAVRKVNDPGAFTRPAAARRSPRTGAGVMRDRRYLNLTAGNALMLLHDSLLFILFPLWTVTRTDLSEAFVGPLLAVNTVLTVVLQVPLSRLAADTGGARRVVRLALVALLGACALFFAVERLSGIEAAVLLVAAIVALTVGENMHSVGAFELSHRLAPHEQVGAYLGVFSLGNSAQLMVGPAFMTAVVLSNPVGWGVLMMAFAGGWGLMLAGSARAPAGTRTGQGGDG